MQHQKSQQLGINRSSKGLQGSPQRLSSSCSGYCTILFPMMSLASWFILPLMGSITDFSTFSAKPGPLPSQTQLSPLPPGVGMGFLFCLWTFWVSSQPTSQNHGCDGGKCPIQGIQSPLRGTSQLASTWMPEQSLTREQKSGQQNTNLSLVQLVWPFLRMPEKQQDISYTSFTYLFEQPLLFSGRGDLKSPVPPLLSPSSIMFKPKWLFHHFRVTLCLAASREAISFFLTLHIISYFCLYFKQL